MLNVKKRHSQRERSPKTERNVSISVAVVLALLALKSLVVGPDPRVVQEQQRPEPSIVALR
jgi:hypothetical protein